MIWSSQANGTVISTELMFKILFNHKHFSLFPKFEIHCKFCFVCSFILVRPRLKISHFKFRRKSHFFQEIHLKIPSLFGRVSEILILISLYNETSHQFFSIMACKMIACDSIHFFFFALVSPADTTFSARFRRPLLLADETRAKNGDTITG